MNHEMTNLALKNEIQAVHHQAHLSNNRKILRAPLMHMIGYRQYMIRS
jgi:hypothetical protein